MDEQVQKAFRIKSKKIKQNKLMRRLEYTYGSLAIAKNGLELSSIATRTVIAALRHWEGESVSLNNSNTTITLYEESLQRIVRRVGGE